MSMKALNDVQLICTMGTTPVNPPRPATGNKPTRLTDNSLLLMFPLLWTQDGVTNMITASAISPLADDIQRYYLPGEPLLVTGELAKFDENIRLRVRGMERSVTNKQTTEVQGAHGPLFSLEGGYSRLTLRGFITRDSEVKGDYFQSILAVRVKDGSAQMRFPLISDVPTKQGQAVAISNGQYTRFLNEEEHEGVIFAPGDSLELGESLKLPANLSTRDPKDRLRLDRVAGLA